MCVSFLLLHLLSLLSSSLSLTACSAVWRRLSCLIYILKSFFGLLCRIWMFHFEREGSTETAEQHWIVGQKMHFVVKLWQSVHKFTNQQTWSLSNLEIKVWRRGALTSVSVYLPSDSGWVSFSLSALEEMTWWLLCWMQHQANSFNFLSDSLETRTLWLHFNSSFLS